MINWKQTCYRKLLGNKILSLFSPFALQQLYLFSRRKPKWNRNSLVSRGSKIEAVEVETAANGEDWILTVQSNPLVRDFIKNKGKGTKSVLCKKSFLHQIFSDHTFLLSKFWKHTHFFKNPNNCDCKPQSIIWPLNPLSQQNDCV